MHCVSSSSMTLSRPTRSSLPISLWRPPRRDGSGRMAGVRRLRTGGWGRGVGEQCCEDPSGCWSVRTWPPCQDIKTGRGQAPPVVPRSRCCSSFSPTRASPASSVSAPGAQGPGARNSSEDRTVARSPGRSCPRPNLVPASDAAAQHRGGRFLDSGRGPKVRQRTAGLGVSPGVGQPESIASSQLSQVKPAQKPAAGLTCDRANKTNPIPDMRANTLQSTFEVSGALLEALPSRLPLGESRTSRSDVLSLHSTNGSLRILGTR